MIDKSYGFYNLTCDICDEEADEVFSNFDEAVEYKKANGWKSYIKLRTGEWQDVCPKCQEK